MLRQQANARTSARALGRFPLLLVREARGAVLLVYLLRSIAGAFSADGGGVLQQIGPLALASATMCASVACVYLYNGLTDIEGDRVNGSSRPLARGDLTVDQVRWTIVSLIALVVAASSVVPVGVSTCNAFMLTLGYAYSGGRAPAKLHGSVGLAVAATGAVLPYFSGALAASGRLPFITLTTALVLGAWVWAIGATKDLSDVDGDASAGRSTLPVRYGSRRARAIISLRAILLAAAAVALSATGLTAAALMVAVPCAGLIVTSCAVSDEAGPSRRLARRPYRAFMMSQFVMNALVIVAPGAL